MINNTLPPLRLVLTANCNGKCSFCHHEGYSGNMDMSIELVQKSATIAEKIHIPCISLTGGEPTMHSQIIEIISSIQQLYSGSISLTTNGYKLLEISDKLECEIQNLNISITSFDPKINENFQNVDVEKVKNAMLNFPSQNKNFNIVVNHENLEYFDDILLFCKQNAINLDIMFELHNNLLSDVHLERDVINKLMDFGDPIIIPGYPSCLSFGKYSGVHIRIKHPKINTIIRRTICDSCEEYSECSEKICAVRVYPDASVSPCLSKHYLFDSSDVKKNIASAYHLFDNDELLLSLFYNNHIE